MKTAGLYIEGGGPVVEFPLNREQFGGNASGGEEGVSGGVEIVIERVLEMPVLAPASGDGGA